MKVTLSDKLVQFSVYQLFNIEIIEKSWINSSMFKKQSACTRGRWVAGISNINQEYTSKIQLRLLIVSNPYYISYKVVNHIIVFSSIRNPGHKIQLLFRTHASQSLSLSVCCLFTPQQFSICCSSS